MIKQNTLIACLTVLAMVACADTFQWTQHPSIFGQTHEGEPVPEVEERPAIARLGVTPAGPGLSIDLLALADTVRSYERPVRTRYVEEVAPRWTSGSLYAGVGDDTATDAVEIRREEIEEPVGWWATTKDFASRHPWITAGGVAGSGAIIYFVGEKQGWWGGSGGGGSQTELTSMEMASEQGNNIAITGDNNSVMITTTFPVEPRPLPLAPAPPVVP